MRRFRDFRLIPLVLVAIATFGVVKVAGLLLNGGYIFRDDVEPGQQSWAQQNLNFPFADHPPAILSMSALACCRQYRTPCSEQPFFSAYIFNEPSQFLLTSDPR
jgi:hypothetical protein